MQKETIKVAIVSDVACPWCYVGKRRLEAAIKKWKGTHVSVTWHPYQLDSNIPAEGLDRNTYLTNKFGNLERIHEMTERLIEAGTDEGITFNFGEKWLAVNTLPLHQLLHVAGEEGFKSTLKERFLKAYFDENLHLNDTTVLHTIMNEFGWDAEKTSGIIADENIAYTVKQEIAHYRQRGVTGVPFFIINDKYGISGAQSPDVFLDVFAQVSSVQTIREGDSCDPVSGEC
ncbi:DsbA family oxidoreductase [Maribacter sp. 2304DJ31-5]|uniref:DsbA family oxidoreductase n=1 Tax=Maribacter sp. 2304DJ31-5 TaxID=3386273 RepID=UPI0039BD5092